MPATVESFFASLRKERVRRKTYRTLAEALNRPGFPGDCFIRVRSVEKLRGPHMHLNEGPAYASSGLSVGSVILSSTNELLTNCLASRIRVIVFIDNSR